MSSLHCFRRSDSKWAWRLTADNGQVVAVDGGQGYDNYLDCQTMADKIVITCGFKDAKRTKEQD